MSKVNVTIAFDFPTLPDEAARELARHIVETHGLIVDGVRVVATRGEGKAFIPKAGKPGSEMVVGGRRFQVWSEADRYAVWAVPFDRQPGEPPLVKLVRHSEGWFARWNDYKPAPGSPAALAASRAA